MRNIRWSPTPERRDRKAATMTGRAVAAAIAALLLAVQVVRNAAVHAFAETRPADAAKLWPGHPASEIGLAMTDIARASRARRAIPASAFAQIADAAVKA